MILNQDPLSNYFDEDKFISDYYAIIYEYLQWYKNHEKNQNLESDELEETAAVFTGLCLLQGKDPVLPMPYEDHLITNEKFIEFVNLILHFGVIYDLYLDGILDFNPKDSTVKITDYGQSLFDEQNRLEREQDQVFDALLQQQQPQLFSCSSDQKESRK